MSFLMFSYQKRKRVRALQRSLPKIEKLLPLSHSKPLKRSVVAAYRQVPQVRVLDELPGPFLGGISLHLVSDVQRCPTVDHFISCHAVWSFVVCMMPL